MKKREDLSGQKFGKWTVIRFAEIRNRRSFFLCACSCGKRKIVCSSTLKNGASQSCGCNISEATKSRLTRHGMADTKPHMIWCAMRQRCGNPNNKAFKNYGGRGISVCSRWQSFQNFWEDMGNTWADGLTIERIDVNGNYEPRNCVWVPACEQARNRRPSSEWNFKNGTNTASRWGISVS